MLQLPASAGMLRLPRFMKARIEIGNQVVFQNPYRTSSKADAVRSETAVVDQGVHR